MNLKLQKIRVITISLLSLVGADYVAPAQVGAKCRALKLQNTIPP